MTMLDGAVKDKFLAMWPSEVAVQTVATERAWRGSESLPGYFAKTCPAIGT